MVASTVAQIALILELFPAAVLIRRFASEATVAGKIALYKSVALARIAFAAAVALMAVIYLVCRPIAPVYQLPVALGLLMLCFRALSVGWAFQALERMRLLAMIEVSSPLLILVGYAIFLRPGATAGGDLAIQCVVNGLVLIIVWCALLRLTGTGDAPAGGIQWSTVRSLLLEGRWLASMSVASFIYMGLETALVGYIRGVEEAGKYRTAQALVVAANIVVSLPPILLFPRFVEWRKQSVSLLWRRQLWLAAAAAVVGLIGAVIAFALMPVFHPWWFGEDYRDAATPAAILITAKMVVLVNSIFGWGIMADADSDRYLALLMCSVAAASLCANIIWSIPRFGIVGAACTNLVSELFILGGTALLARYSTRRRPQ